MTNTITINQTIENAIANINTRTYATEVVKEFGLENQAELMAMVAKFVGDSQLENAEMLETFLMLKASQLLPKAVAKKEKKVNPETQQRLEVLQLEEVKDELKGTYFDRAGLAHILTKYGATTSDGQATPFANNHAIENELLVKVEKATFPKEDGGKRKATAYILAEDIENLDELVPFLHKA